VSIIAIDSAIYRHNILYSARNTASSLHFTPWPIDREHYSAARYAVHRGPTEQRENPLVPYRDHLSTVPRATVATSQPNDRPNVPRPPLRRAVPGQRQPTRSDEVSRRRAHSLSRAVAVFELWMSNHLNILNGQIKIDLLCFSSMGYDIPTRLRWILKTYYLYCLDNIIN